MSLMFRKTNQIQRVMREVREDTLRTDAGSLFWQAPLGGGKVTMGASISLDMSIENGVQETSNTEKWEVKRGISICH